MRKILVILGIAFFNYAFFLLIMVTNILNHYEKEYAYLGEVVSGHRANAATTCASLVGYHVHLIYSSLFR